MTRTIIGLTGSIGMGKSTTAAMFAGARASRSGTRTPPCIASTPPAVRGRGACPISRPRPLARTGGQPRDPAKAAIAENPDLLGRSRQRIHPLVAEDRAAFLDAHARRYRRARHSAAVRNRTGSKPWTRSSSSRPLRRRTAPPRSCTPRNGRGHVRASPCAANPRCRKTGARRSSLSGPMTLATARADVEDLLNQIRAGKRDA
jgi:energy-coupling factor transporter ATP-binding protein EcfA2